MKSGGGRSGRLLDLVGVLLVGVVFLTCVLPALGKLRRSSRVEACADNLRAIGITAKIYANDHGGHWMMPAFANLAVLEGDGIDYLNEDGTKRPPNTDPGEVGWQRDVESRSETFIAPTEGSTAVSTTRSFWILVRSGDLDIEQFICPSSNDRPNPVVEAFNHGYLVL